MESSIRNSGTSAGMRTSLSRNSGEGEKFNKEKKQVPSSSSPFSSELKSQDHFDLMPNATATTTHHPRPLGATSPTHDQTYSKSELHNTHSANPFGEAHSSSSQNPFLVMSDSTNTKHGGASESEKVQHDNLHSLPAMQQEKGGMTSNSASAFPSDGMLGPHSSLAPSTNESSQGNRFKAPTSATSKNTPVGSADLRKVDEHHDHGNESHHRLPSPEQGHWSMPSSEARTHPSNTHGETHVPSSSQQLDPLFTLESAQNQRQADATSENRAGATTIPTSVESHHTFSATEQGHHSKISSNSGTNKKSGSPVSSFSPASESSTQDQMRNSTNAATKAPQKRGKDVKFASGSSDDDIPISSFPKHGQQGSSDGAGQYSSAGVAPGTSNGSEKQNPPLQVMERPENPTTSSNYRFPSHVFDRHKSKSNTQWSTASNESLFSIQMGNTSFSNDMAWMSKSGDMDKPGEMNSSGAFPPSNQPPLPPQFQPQTQPQPPATKFNDISQSTAKQHEGSSRLAEEKAAETMREVIMENSIKRDSPSKGDSVPAGRATRSNRHSSSNHNSHQSDGSTKSFAFNVLTDGDKPLSSKYGEEKRKQQKQPEQENIKPTPDAAAQTAKPTPNASQNKSWLSCFSCC